MTRKPNGLPNRLTCMCRGARTRAFTAIACVLGVVFSVPVFAQMDTRARATDAQTLALAFNRSVTGVVRAYVPTELPAPESVPVPPPALIAGTLRPLIESMLRRSPTFRRQCQRLASPRLHAVSLNHEVLRGVRAITQMTMVDGRMSAMVRLGSGDDDVELIAHEIEHIIEQLDGVDLPARSALPGTGVYLCSSGRPTFETVRAIRAGRRVAQEFRQNGS
jgi:hypothetical protein